MTKKLWTMIPNGSYYLPRDFCPLPLFSLKLLMILVLLSVPKLCISRLNKKNYFRFCETPSLPFGSSLQSKIILSETTILNPKSWHVFSPSHCPHRTARSFHSFFYLPLLFNINDLLYILSSFCLMGTVLLSCS
jgi:hypothetical protein